MGITSCVLVEMRLTVSGDIVFQDGDDAIDNEGEIVVDGSIKFGMGDDILRQLGPKMIVKKGIDFGGEMIFCRQMVCFRLAMVLEG